MKLQTPKATLHPQRPVVVQVKTGPSAFKIALWIFLMLTFGPALLYLLFLLLIFVSAQMQ